MGIFRDLKIKNKFLLGYGAILLLLIIASSVNYLLMADLVQEIVKEGAVIDNLAAGQAEKESAKLKELQSGFHEIRNEAVKDGKVINTVILISLLLVIGVIIVFYLLINSTVTEPVNALARATQAIAGGDLSVDIGDTGQKDEVGSLVHSIKEMREALVGIITDLSATSDQVSSSAGTLTSTVRQISHKVSDQANRAGQIATSSTEMSQTVMDIARNAAEIASSAKETLTTAKSGADVVGKTVNEVQEISRTVTDLAQVMTSLGDRSKQIGEIVGVINDIADQTNLLALNAAIEAARAGEQGRGFAVVADEVRKLAEKTAKATMEISEMIKAIQNETDKAVTSMDESLQRVESGANFSTQAGSALQRIVSSVQELQTMVQQIASATEEMSTVTEEMGRDIEAIALASSETSGDADHISGTSDDLTKLADSLQKILSQFRMHHAGRPRIGHSQWNK